MKKIFILLFFTIISISSTSSKKNNAFEVGEYLKFRIHYGIINAGYAELSLNEKNYNGNSLYYIKGIGYTVGGVKLFFKVNDLYETYINKNSLLSSRFERNINEGSYSRNQSMFINNSNKSISYIDNIKKETKNYNYKNGEMHDILSAFYYLRNISNSQLTTGKEIYLNIFFDNEFMNFKLKVLGRETLKTKFGNINCIKIRPYVISGRVFKEKESVTMWVTDDDSHVPLQIQASLAVGSLKASLDSYKNIKGSNFLK